MRRRTYIHSCRYGLRSSSAVTPCCNARRSASVLASELLCLSRTTTFTYRHPDVLCAVSCPRLAAKPGRWKAKLPLERAVECRLRLIANLTGDGSHTVICGPE